MVALSLLPDTCPDEFYRDFLLFIPQNTVGLKTVLSYYSAGLQLSTEGDANVSDDAIQGLGNEPAFPTSFVQAVFSISAPRRHMVSKKPFSGLNDTNNPSTTTPPHDSSHTQVDVHGEPFIEDELYGNPEHEREGHMLFSLGSSITLADIIRKELLTLVDPGYFIAGGISGAVSRTATAPFDRLKVYLIAQTGVKKDTLEAVKSAQPIEAAKKASRPLTEAMKALWRAGGVRSLFAGRYQVFHRGFC
jgi:solute carrier family 25 (mitochondrial phosphate transporter), member 23/24/25/41